MDITIFKSEQFGEIRTVKDEKGEPWFVGVDVATVLGYSQPSKAVRDHTEEEDRMQMVLNVTEPDVQNGQVVSPGYKTKTNLINESGLYSLILGSKLPQAREFKHWVTAVVLPQIRKTGGYIPVAPEDDDVTILSKALLIMKRTIEQKDALLEEQKPKVIFADAVADTEDSILIRQLAKLITQNGYEIGERRLFVWLKANGYLFKKDHDNSPRQEWVEKGLFTTTVSLIQTHHGSIERITTRVTGKGQRYFVNGFITGAFKAGNKELADMMCKV